MINHPMIQPVATRTDVAKINGHTVGDVATLDEARAQLATDLEATLQRLLNLTALCEGYVAA